jgi:hypothetical protein
MDMDKKTKKQMCAYCGACCLFLATRNKQRQHCILTPWSGHGLVATGLLGRRPPPRAPVPLCAARETMAVSWDCFVADAVASAAPARVSFANAAL